MQEKDRAAVRKLLCARVSVERDCIIKVLRVTLEADCSGSVNDGVECDKDTSGEDKYWLV